MQCATPNCRAEGGHGDYFLIWCKPCASNLRRIREEATLEMTVTGRYAMRSDQRRTGMPTTSTCCVIGCYEPRDHPEPFCPKHLDEGYVEEAA